MEKKYSQVPRWMAAGGLKAFQLRIANMNRNKIVKCERAFEPNKYQTHEHIK